MNYSPQQFGGFPHLTIYRSRFCRVLRSVWQGSREKKATPFLHCRLPRKTLRIMQKKQTLLLAGLLALLSVFTIVACKKDDSSSDGNSISALNCASATFSGTATVNVAYSGTATVPYTGGNGTGYSAGSSIASTGVTGLTAMLSAGTLASGNGNLTYTINGTPASSGTASFAISFGGQSCTLSLAVNAASGGSATVTGLSCSSATFSATATANSAYSATATVPYTGGNGLAYAAGTAISSTGVTGLTATLTAGTLASGAGNLTFNLTGTPTSSGTASFAISFGGQSCTVSLTVGTSSTTNCDAQTGVAKLVCLCDAFKASLSSTQLAAVQLSYTYANIRTWSNLPAQLSPRIGIPFSSLNATQLVLAKAIVKELSGTTANEGWDEVQQTWLADDYLAANGGGSAYGTGNFYLAFFGIPSTTGKFEIMMTGHHKTVANTYESGALVAATPHFTAIEPLSFTSGSATIAPMEQEKNAFVAILASLSATELAAAKSGSTFSDLVLRPGQDWQFPTTSSGLKCSNLTSAQKTLVLNAIKTYVYDIDDANATTIFNTYASAIDDTYILYSGTTAMNTRNDYFRIDGPKVWIEFSVQNGVVLSGVHYHSIWRDRVTDYAGTKQ